MEVVGILVRDGLPSLSVALVAVRPTMQVRKADLSCRFLFEVIK